MRAQNRCRWNAAVLLLSPFLLLGVALAEERWELLGDEDGVKVWRAEVPDSPTVAMRGEGIIDAPVGRIACVLGDTARTSDWVSEIAEARVVRVVSATERVVYQRVATPWPLDDREFVFTAKVSYDRARHEVVYRMSSVEDPAVPRSESRVRGVLHQSIFTLAPIDSGTRTRMTVEVHADPMGSIPKSLVNFFQKSWPRDTLKNIRREVTKPWVHELESIAVLMSG